MTNLPTNKAPEELNKQFQQKEEMMKQYKEQDPFMQELENKAKKYEFLKSFQLTDYYTNCIQAHHLSPYFYDTKTGFWLWNNKKQCYEQKNDLEMMNHIEELFNIEGRTIIKNLSANYIEAMKRIGIQEQHKPKDLPKTWVQFKNKIIDITTGTEHQSNPSLFCVNPIPWNVSNNAETPIIDQLCKEWVGSVEIKKLQQIAAYCLLRDYPIHRMFFFYGQGSNGKSCYLTFIKKLLGEDNCSSTELTQIIERFGTTPLYKKLVCIIGETNDKTLNKTSTLKRLTGDDLIHFEFKHRDLFSAMNTAKIMISTNNIPRTTDKSDGWYRRQLIITFPNMFKEKSDLIKNIPETEMNNFCYKATLLLKELLQTMQFNNEESVEEKRQKYEFISNPVMQFVKERCKQDINGIIPVWLFYEQFINWSESRGYKTLTKNKVSIVMRDEGYETIVKNVRVEGSNDWVSWRHYGGISWHTINPITTITSLRGADKVLENEYREISLKRAKDVTGVNNLPLDTTGQPLDTTSVSCGTSTSTSISTGDSDIISTLLLEQEQWKEQLFTLLRINHRDNEADYLSEKLGWSRNLLQERLKQLLWKGDIIEYKKGYYQAI